MRWACCSPSTISAPAIPAWIDRSFVRDITSDGDSAAIVRAVVQMAASLKLKTIAEGVETDAQAVVLRATGCDEVQGFLYARPMPAAECEAYLRGKA